MIRACLAFPLSERAGVRVQGSAKLPPPPTKAPHYPRQTKAATRSRATRRFT